MPESGRPAAASPPAASPPAASPPPAPSSPAAVFGRLVHGVCDARWDELPGLYAELTHVVHPLDPERSAPLLTREALDEHFRRGAEVLAGLRMQPAAITVHETSDPEVIVGEFEYRGVAPGTGEPFAIPNVFVIRVRDGQIVESRDYADHVEIARVLGTLDELAGAVRGRAGAAPAARPVPASAPEPAGDGWQDRARLRYEDAAFGDDTGALAAADQELDAVEAGLALARGRIMHARFLAGGEPDEATLAQFRRAAEFSAKLGDARGEAEALFWVATFHQAVRGDHETALPLLERAGQLAAAAGDLLTLSYVARHLGFADESAGRTERAGQRFAESLRLRREAGFEPGVAAALLALAEFTASHGDQAEAGQLLAEAEQTARRCGARGVQRRIEQARAAVRASGQHEPALG
jgi:ketosteroid isomerase-like protein